MKRVELLQQNKVKPFIVFDGCELPMKIDEKRKHKESRDKSLAKARRLESGDAAAVGHYKHAVNITPLIVHKLIEVLKKQDISYVVAPYEADAQMAFLAIHGRVNAVLTSDADLVAFGCPRIIFRMDDSGRGHEFKDSKLLEHPKLNGFTQQTFLELCVLRGCDYLRPLNNMNWHIVLEKFQKYGTYDKVIEHLKESAPASIYTGYKTEFRKAMLTFKHQRVYDPNCESTVLLSGLSEDELRSNLPKDVGNDLSFLGPWIENDVAKGIAEGVINPLDRMPFD
ncbi:exonuclease 1 isoform X2 [Eucalyptus grandis]|uniref:exonuclease 1 isoform X2 n=1 Tax=Eucalyptus grandis TaxID=71139 RepID=UPI00192EC766|nr:exonuclease 1 isoform X2 [Eucalyptus grandis]